MRGLPGLVVCALLVTASPGAAQEDVAEGDPPATLIADRIEATPEGVLTASGNVEVFYDGQRLTASEVVYTRETGRLQISGPIRVTGTEGEVILADSADLADDFTDGLLTSARLVLDQQLQLAAVELQRVEGRYSQMFRTVASSCEVCEENRTPLWQIRARKVIHDELERQLYFEDATLEVAGLPVFYFPRLRLPDPTLERATGFLVPGIRTTNSLGFGVEVPYFYRINDHADLTLTPFVTAKDSRSLQLRYRQAFVAGDLRFEGAFTRDELEEGSRGYGIFEGAFALPRDFTVDFRLESVSDAAYYRDYGLPEKDRINSNIGIDRARRDVFLRADVDYFRTFRDGEDNETEPSFITDAEYQYRIDMPGIGGQGELELGLFDLARESNEDIVGRDVNTLKAQFDWRRSWYAPQGLVGTAVTQFRSELTNVEKDSRFDDSINVFQPAAAFEVRWPLQATTGSGRTIVEPIGQIIYTQPSSEEVPVEDTTPLEFDEASLLDLFRFSDSLRSDGGFQGNLGLSTTYFGPSGWEAGLTFARVWLEDDNRGVIPELGVTDPVTDYLTTFRLKAPFGLQFINRLQYSEDFDINKNALRLNWARALSSFSATYTWLRASVADNRPLDTNEVLLNAAHTFNRNWSARAEYRYDFEISNARNAILDVVWQNECITVALSAETRFSPDSRLRSTTSFGINVALDGFGNNNKNRLRQSNCRR